MPENLLHHIDDRFKVLADLAPVMIWRSRTDSLLDDRVEMLSKPYGREVVAEKQRKVLDPQPVRAPERAVLE